MVSLDKATKWQPFPKWTSAGKPIASSNLLWLACDVTRNQRNLKPSSAAKCTCPPPTLFEDVIKYFVALKPEDILVNLSHLVTWDFHLDLVGLPSSTNHQHIAGRAGAWWAWWQITETTCWEKKQKLTKRSLKLWVPNNRWVQSYLFWLSALHYPPLILAKGGSPSLSQKSGNLTRNTSILLCEMPLLSGTKPSQNWLDMDGCLPQSAYVNNLLRSPMLNGNNEHGAHTREV